MVPARRRDIDAVFKAGTGDLSFDADESSESESLQEWQESLTAISAVVLFGYIVS